MRFWGFGREKRSAVDTVSSTAYVDARLAAILAAAQGDSAADVNAIAAAEIASGLWGRAFASARVEPDTIATRAITPATLELIGRELVRKGEALFLLQVRGGTLAMMPVSWWDTYGSYLPESWTYQITLAGPDETYTMRVRGDRLVHARYGCTPTEPWRGVSPLAHARTTSDLASMIEHRLAQEATAPAGQILPVPGAAADPQTIALGGTLKNLKGRLGLVPSMSGNWSGAKQDAPRMDYETRRLGANPPASLDMLRSSSARHVLAACGVPIELAESSEGTGAREAFRRFLHATITPAARLVELELSQKLDVPVKLDFSGLMASDLSGRARAFQSLVGGGMDIAEAAALAGLMEE